MEWEEARRLVMVVRGSGGGQSTWTTSHGNCTLNPIFYGEGTCHQDPYLSSKGRPWRFEWLSPIAMPSNGRGGPTTSFRITSTPTLTFPIRSPLCRETPYNSTPQYTIILGKPGHRLRTFAHNHKLLTQELTRRNRHGLPSHSLGVLSYVWNILNCNQSSLMNFFQNAALIRIRAIAKL